MAEKPEDKLKARSLSEWLPTAAQLQALANIITALALMVLALGK